MEGERRGRRERGGRRGRQRRHHLEALAADEGGGDDGAVADEELDWAHVVAPPPGPYIQMRPKMVIPLAPSPPVKNFQ